MKIVIGLAVVIVILLLIFIFVPAPEKDQFVYNDFIRVDPESVEGFVSSPFVITGEARGHWFFEANFPVFLLDENGKTIVAHYAEAIGEWMTEEYVPFRAVLESPDMPADGTGTLILAKSNASGLPEHDDEFRIPIRFMTSNNVPVMFEYDGKIVYGVSQDLNVEMLQSDCDLREGTFDICGTTCEPNATVCDAVCAFTCEF